MLNTGISLVVPVYNESEIIADTLAIFTRELSLFSANFEIIVVDDGSTDGTADILNRLLRENSHLRVFNNTSNQGSGASLWKGFQHAEKELLVSNFADRPFAISDLEGVIRSVDLNKTDFIVVVRKDRSANTNYRKLTSHINYWLIRLLFGVAISDFQFVQVYKRSILNDIRIRSKETFVPPELMIRLLDKGFKYREVIRPFHKRPGGRPKCGHPRKVCRSIKEIFCFWFYWTILKKRE
ncbi:MAG: glycosyltransferase family 2 protein [Candidatus Omnitrophota bacterium]|jgi:dolichol-phosphate mannosyltransferase